MRSDPVVISLLAKCYGLLTVVLVVLPTFSAFASPPEQEIKNLIVDVKRSNCTFVRNGSSHNSAEAADHIDKKYDYYKKRISTPEDFIRLAATGSALSGKPYEVRCPGAPAMSSAEWLKQRLVILRGQSKERP